MYSIFEVTDRLSRKDLTCFVDLDKKLANFKRYLKNRNKMRAAKNIPAQNEGKSKKILGIKRVISSLLHLYLRRAGIKDSLTRRT